MSEAVLTVLKFCFLALLYLFLARVVRVVVLELRNPTPAAAAASAPAPSEPGRKERRASGVLRLRLLEPAGRKGELWAIPDEVTVGRGGGCGIVLADDTYVSTLHARLFQQNGEAFVEDLGSTNGTFVNGRQVTTATRLKRGDQVQFGQTVAEAVR
ncbi:MAG: FHA domain-containing protein [Acidimicrobiia bacterium]